MVCVYGRDVVRMRKMDRDVVWVKGVDERERKTKAKYERRGGGGVRCDGEPELGRRVKMLGDYVRGRYEGRQGSGDVVMY